MWLGLIVEQAFSEVSTSLFSSWDKQFYPEMAKHGSQIIQLDVDTEMLA